MILTPPLPSAPSHFAHCPLHPALVNGPVPNAVFFAIPCFSFLVKFGISNTAYAFKYTEWIGVLSHVWLLYFYVSLALRENILQVVRL